MTAAATNFFGQHGGMPRPSAAPVRTCARGASREGVISFVGLCAFAATIQLYDNYLILESVPAINYSLFTGAAQIVTFAVAALAGALGYKSLPAASVSAAGVTTAASTIVLSTAQQPETCLAAAVVLGASLGWLALAWVSSFSGLAARATVMRVLGAFSLSAGITLACFLAPPLASACMLVLPLVAGFLYLAAQNARAQAEHADPDVAAGVSASDAVPRAPRIPRATMPASFLTVLTTCSLTCSFFAGITCYPYCFQSDHIVLLAHALTLCALPLMLACARLSQRPAIQPLFVGSLILLLGGFLLFSTGVLGSIITPLGLILTAKNCLVALGYATLGVLLRERPRTAPLLVCGCGLILGNAALGRCVGMFVNNNTAPDFSDIALGASVCIAAFAVIYAITTSRHAFIRTPVIEGAETTGAAAESRAYGFEHMSSSEAAADGAAQGATARLHAQASPAEVAGPPEPVWLKRLEALDLTRQEHLVASLILQRQTYSSIAKLCDISERTVKFHAKNIYEKAHVTNRRDFEVMINAKK